MKGSLTAAVAALLFALTASSAPGDEPPKEDASAPRFRLEAVLHDYEPLSDRAARSADLYWAGVAADWARGGYSVKVEVRGTEGRFRPFYAGSVWLEEGWAAVRTPAGDLRLGKVAPLVGLADETFSGNLFSLNGVTRNPGWGAQLEGEARSGHDTIAWSAVWTGQNDGVGWEEDGRDVESDPGRRLRDGLAVRASYLLNEGLWSLRPALSAATARLVPTGAGDEFRRNDFASDLTATLGPLAVFVEGFWRSGQACAGGAACRYGYADARAALAGFRAEFPTVTYRYTWSRWHYVGAATVEEIHMPGVVWTPKKGISASIEYSARSLRTLLGEGTVKSFHLGLAVSF
ncbi:MAG: hypothetical protein WCC53_00205 [Thermoanaerobaculia bacterium]